MKQICIFALATLIWVGAAGKLHAASDPALWKALRTDDHIALMRHAVAPGFGDPEGFVLEDCDTQRNLSDDGRDQARRIGDSFRANGIEAASLFSSQWCRCLETAKLLDLGAIEVLSALNSFFRDFGYEETQTDALSAWIGERKLDRPHVLVTHQVNITALTGIYPASGEIVIIKHIGGGDVEVVGTIRTD